MIVMRISVGVTHLRDRGSLYIGWEAAGAWKLARRRYVAPLLFALRLILHLPSRSVR
jgi:hypothetical protein